MSQQCEFCKKIVGSRKYLLKHQKQTKKCLKIQEELRATENKERKLIELERMLSEEKVRNNMLQENYDDLKEKYQQEIERNRDLREKYNDERKAHKYCIEKYYEEKERHNKLEEKYERVLSEDKERNNELQKELLKAAQRPITNNTTNNTNNINTVIQKLSPLTDDCYIDNLPYLTIRHVEKGGAGFAEYALEYPLKDKLVCVDPARKKIKYKNDKGEIMVDPGMHCTRVKFFKSVKKRSDLIFNDYIQDEEDRLAVMECMEIANKVRTQVSDAAQGGSNKLTQTFDRIVCSKTMVSNL